jgi:hypothetical protein
MDLSTTGMPSKSETVMISFTVPGHMTADWNIRPAALALSLSIQILFLLNRTSISVYSVALDLFAQKMDWLVRFSPKSNLRFLNQSNSDS